MQYILCKIAYESGSINFLYIESEDRISGQFDIWSIPTFSLIINRLLNAFQNKSVYLFSFLDQNYSKMDWIVFSDVYGLI